MKIQSVVPLQYTKEKHTLFERQWEGVQFETHISVSTILLLTTIFRCHCCLGSFINEIAMYLHTANYYRLITDKLKFLSENF